MSTSCENVCLDTTCSALAIALTCSDFAGLGCATACNGCCHDSFEPSSPPVVPPLLPPPVRPPPLLPPPSLPPFCVLDVEGVPCLSIWTYISAGCGLLLLGALLLWRWRASVRQERLRRAASEETNKDRGAFAAKQRRRSIDRHSISKQSRHGGKARRAEEQEEQEQRTPSRAELPDGWQAPFELGAPCPLSFLLLRHTLITRPCTPQERRDDVGARYFVHELTNTTSWTYPQGSPKPLEPVDDVIWRFSDDDEGNERREKVRECVLAEIRAEIERGPAPLPSGWECFLTEHGMPYYYHRPTDKSSWFPPS